jgi:tetratricopeptide (TPR) repeat protein
LPNDKTSNLEKFLWAGNIILFLAIFFLLTNYFDALKWSHQTVYKYMDNRIPSSADRIRYREAAGFVRTRNATIEHRKILEEAVKADPNSMATFWLAEYHLSINQPDEALVHYLEFIDRDPSIPRANNVAARILLRQGKPEEALRVLDIGISYFEKMATLGTPIKDKSVHNKYNNKAKMVHKNSIAALNALRVEREKIASKK